MTIELDSEVARRLDEVAKVRGMPKDKLVYVAILEMLEDTEDYNGAVEVVKNPRGIYFGDEVEPEIEP
ncbi:MAG: CopG family transcriptional regulator [Opitutales bacterium]